jgi:dolichyl-phosphate beta-glucosyltransferase
VTAGVERDAGPGGHGEPGRAPPPEPRVGIVVPCFNEAHRLRSDIFREFTRRGHPVRFLFVNDGSTDDTRAVLDALERDAPAQVALLDLPTNTGKADAVRRGMLEVFRWGVTYAGFWDADLATPLDAIPAFAAILDGASQLEMVFGARVLLMGRSIRRSARRHYAGRVFATAASLALGLPIYDTQCGAKLFRATPAVQALFQEPFRSRWIFDVELVARLVRARRGTPAPPPAEVIYEYPLEQWHDVPGSKVRAVDFPRAAIELARIYLAYLR